MTSTSIALPTGLKDWLRAEADRLDMSLSAYVTHLLMVAQEQRDQVRIACLEARVGLLEKVAQRFERPALYDVVSSK